MQAEITRLPAPKRFFFHDCFFLSRVRVCASRRTIQRKRKGGEDCKIPNTGSTAFPLSSLPFNAPISLSLAVLHEISCGQTGCFALCFSPDGRTLAAACGEPLLFTVKVRSTYCITRTYHIRCSCLMLRVAGVCSHSLVIMIWSMI